MTNASLRLHGLKTFRLKMLTLLSGLACASLVAGHALAKDRIEVQVDQAKVMTIPANVKTMVLGNPGIADVTLLKHGGKMVITGKGYGETNLIALDSDSNLLFESSIRVSAPAGNLIVQRGADRNSYSCNPRCEPTVSLGDAADYMGAASGQVQVHSGFAKPGTSEGPPK